MIRMHSEDIPSKVEEYIASLENALVRNDYEKALIILDRLSPLQPHMTPGQQDFYYEATRVAEDSFSW